MIVKDPRAAFHYFGSHKGHCVSYTMTEKSQIDLADIALSLSRQCRCVGHSALSVGQHSLVSAFLSLDSLESLPPNERSLAPLYVLLHDAHEAYYGDVPNPLKITLKDLWHEHTEKTTLAAIKNYHKSTLKTPFTKAMERDALASIQEQMKGQNYSPLGQIEANLDAAIRDAFNIPLPSPEMKTFVRHCDLEALSLEMRDILPAAQSQTFTASGYKFPEPRTDVILKTQPQPRVEDNFKQAVSLLTAAALLPPTAFTEKLPELKTSLLSLSGLQSPQQQAVRPDFSKHEQAARETAAALFNQGKKEGPR